MPTHPYQEVADLGRNVRELLFRLDRKSLELRANSYEPSVAESIALALLELDRIAVEPGIRTESLPPFASDFLNRRLTKRMLDRYPAAELTFEFDRRLTGALERLASSQADSRNGRAIERLYPLLIDLESTLLQRPHAAGRNVEH